MRLKEPSAKLFIDLTRCFVRIIIINMKTILSWAILSLVAISALTAEEVKVKKGIVKLEINVESRARDVSEERLNENEIVKDRTTIFTNRSLLRAGTAFFDRVEIFGEVGGSDLSAPNFDDFDSPVVLSYGGGLKVTLYESPYRGHARSFIGARYIQHQTHKDTVNTCIKSSDPQSSDYYCNTGYFLTAVDEEIDWKEFENEIGFGWQAGTLVLEAGIRLSFIDSRDRIIDRGTGEIISHMRLHPDDNAGLFIRADIFFEPEERFALNIGVSTLDVNSVYAGVKIWF